MRGLKARRVQRLGWKKDSPDRRDLLFSPKTTAPLPEKVDLRPNWTFTPFDQGDLGSCTANAISAAVVFSEQKEGANDPTPGTIPSRLAVYWWERFLENSVDSDSGAEIRDGLKVVNKKGYIDEAKWPYDTAKFKDPPPDFGPKPEHVYKYHRVRQSLNSMLRCLAEGYPFVFGITVYSSFMSAASGEIPMPATSEAVEGGHAILGMGYDSTSARFTFLNSWGTSWGKAGYGTIPFAYLTDPNLGGDYWTIRKET